jgi:Tfp pilus assembly protein PilZ
VDLSSGGCYLQAQLAGLSDGAEGELRVVFPHNKRSYALTGQVVWINHAGAHEKPAGFGFRFFHKQMGFLKEATLRYGRGMLVR